MKRVAVVLTASLALVLAACAVEKPVEVSASRTEMADAVVSSDDSAASNNSDQIAGRVGVPPGPVALSDARQNGQTAVGTASDEAVRAATAANDGDESVRDAKEAAEEAARKIVDATRDAANLIKEVGLGAVQSVRESASRSDDESAGEELAATDERVD